MHSISQLIRNFFTHKDFLPPADQIAGTLFTPLHLLFALVVVALLSILAIYFSKKSEKTIKTTYTVLWILLVIWEIAKITWETVSGKTVNFEWAGVLPLYPCSVFLYALPFAIWGKGYVRKAACGYICSVGFLGGVVNFVYPQNILSNYSCLSFAGFHTFFYHASIVFCAATMLASGYHSLKGVKKWWELLVPSVPLVAVSIIANLVNFSPIDSDYMWFKLESIFFAPIGAATADWLSVIMVYAAYLLIHALPLLPSYIANHKKQ